MCNIKNEIINKVVKVGLSLLIVCSTTFYLGLDSFRVLATGGYIIATANTDYTITLSEESYNTLAEAIDALALISDPNAVVANESGKIYAMKNGLVATIGGSTRTFKNKNAGMSVYITTDCTGFYVKTADDGDVTMGISGFKGELSSSQVVLIPDTWVSFGDTKDRYFYDYYGVNSSGNMVHYLSYYSPTALKTTKSSFTVDKAPDFMVSGERYYSYDGINYYENPNDIFDDSKTPVGVHYVYFKYLSYRSETSYDADDINRYYNYLDRTNSVLNDEGDSFIKTQETWGVNSLLQIAFANLESAYGTSGYARERYNIFGISATDSNPNGASYYDDVYDCVNQHGKYLMSQGYLDAYAFIDSSIKNNNPAFYDVDTIQDYAGDSRYIGSNSGNKSGGVNVKYASDPYHGEKIAGLAYSMDKYLGSHDYNKYTIGVTTDAAYAYSEPDTSSWKLYQYTTKTTRNTSSAGPDGMPVVILGTEGDFYIIQSEMPIKDDRAYYTWEYNFETDIAYVLKSKIQIINNDTIDKLPLMEALDDYLVVDRQLYTTSSLATYDNAYQNAQSILNKEDVRQSELDQAKETLKDAYQALVLIVIEYPITAINLNYNDFELIDNMSAFQVEASIIPSNASVKDLTYNSSDPTVATISNSGLVTPIKSGITTISVSSMDGSKIVSSFNLTITVNSMESSEYSINKTSELISNVPLNTTIADFLTKVNSSVENSRIEVYNKDDQLVTNGLVMTSMKVKMFVSNNLSQVLTISVISDVNGNGDCEITDFILLRNHLLNSNVLEAEKLVACDINKDGKVEITDFILMRNILLEGN